MNKIRALEDVCDCHGLPSVAMLGKVQNNPYEYVCLWNPDTGPFEEAVRSKSPEEMFDFVQEMLSKVLELVLPGEPSQGLVANLRRAYEHALIQTEPPSVEATPKKRPPRKPTRTYSDGQLTLNRARGIRKRMKESVIPVPKPQPRIPKTKAWTEILVFDSQDENMSDLSQTQLPKRPDMGLVDQLRKSYLKP